MNWTAPLHVSRALTLQLTANGWVANNSVSRRAQAVESDALPVLEVFSSSIAPREALARLRESWEVEEDEFATVVGRLLEEGWLVDPDGAAADLAAQGFASAVAHYHMLRDRRRVDSYRAAIERHCRGRTVVEVGCGSGALSLLAARAGARRVVAIEESEIAGLAREMIDANGLADVVELVTANSRDVELDERADVLIHELFGSDPFEENFLAYIADARDRFLTPEGRLIPSRLEVACRGFAVEETHRARRQAAVETAEELGRAYGLDFGPLAQALATSPERRFARHAAIPGGEPFDRTLLSAEALVCDLDLSRDEAGSLAEGHEIDLSIERSGTLGGLVTYFRAHLDAETVLSTSPENPPTHWGWNLTTLSSAREVEAGERVALAVQTSIVHGIPQLRLDLA